MHRLNRFRRKKQRKGSDSQSPLLNDIMHTETTDEKISGAHGEQLPNTERTEQSDVYPDLISTKFVVVSGERVLNIIKETLSAHSNPQDLQTAAVMINTWGKMNGVTVDKKKGSYPEDWLCEFQQLIDKHIEQHFPILPVESTTTQRSEQIEEFLNSTENMMFNEVHRLSSVLKDAGLLSYLIQSYHHHLFPKLDLLVNKDLSVNETFCLLQWGKRVFFSPDSQDVFSDCDPLMFSGWFERAKQKMLTILKDEISRVLQNILDFEEEDNEDNERSMDDEWFIRVQTDVTQCLIPVIQNAKKCSLTLMNSVQILCLEELHSFAQKYVNGEMKRLENLQSINKKISRRTSNLRAKRNKLLETLQPLQTNFVYLCKTTSTCMKLRCLAIQISNLDKNESVDVLKQLEDHVLSLMQNMIKDLAQVSLESYFEKSDDYIYNLTEEIEKQCESLPQTQAAEEIRTIIVNLACNCVSRVYLDCLMKIKVKRLQRRWVNVEERIRQDVQNLHEKFAQLNADVEQNQLLMRMSEVLFYCDVETLKFTCGTLFKDFPEDSEQYLPRLLRWKRTLSEQQVKEILDVGQTGCQNPARDSRPQPLMDLCCCLGF